MEAVSKWSSTWKVQVLSTQQPWTCQSSPRTTWMTSIDSVPNSVLNLTNILHSNSRMINKLRNGPSPLHAHLKQLSPGLWTWLHIHQHPYWVSWLIIPLMKVNKLRCDTWPKSLHTSQYLTFLRSSLQSMWNLLMCCRFFQVLFLVTTPLRRQILCHRVNWELP